MKKLEREALTADQEAVRGLLRDLSPNDPIGRLSFGSRLSEIEEQLKRLAGRPDHAGAVALLFGGDPVFGSRSIDAEFASKAISTFQDLITKSIAGEEYGRLGERGPIPLRTAAALSVKEIVRGSVGFVLEESERTEPLADTAVKKAIDDVTAIIARTAAENIEAFEQAAETLDGRVLVSLRHFFRALDDNSASVRIVEDERDEVLDIAAVRRARQRVDLLDIEEHESDAVIGDLLGVLPDSRRFEMRLADSGEIIRGSVASAYARHYLEELIARPGQEGLIGRRWRAKMKIREIRERNKPPRHLYTLLGLIEPIGD